MIRGFSLLFLAGCAAPLQDPAEPGAIAGVVERQGTPLKDAFVYIKEGLGDRRFEVPQGPVVLDQAGLQFAPRVFGIRVGQTLRITSQDTSQHNVNCQPFKNPPFNVSMFDGEVRESRFTTPEAMILLQCNFHPEMKAYAGVVDHPFFAVTDAQGAFTIRGVPPGRYTVEAWQEDLGTRRVEVEVGEARGASIRVRYPQR